MPVFVVGYAPQYQQSAMAISTNCSNVSVNSSFLALAFLAYVLNASLKNAVPFGRLLPIS